MSFKKEDILGTWLHSHEEDTGDRQVYRPKDFEFPPARGRFGWAFHPGGVAAAISPGAVDRGQQTDATWNLKGSQLQVIVKGQEEVFEVISLNSDQLILRKGKTTNG